MFPRIDRPCPYADRLAQVMEGDYCRMCKRTVFDLSAMDERERRAFLGGCAGEEICVRYTVRPALAAVALAASVIALPALAQQAPAPDSLPAAADEDARVHAGVELHVVQRRDREPGI